MASGDPKEDQKKEVSEVVEVKEVVNEKYEQQPQNVTNEKQPLPDMKNLTVEELYDKEKYDMSTMEPGDVFTLLQ